MFSPSKHQILVVDDEPSVRESMVMLLTSSGYDVTAAADGFAALEQLRRMLPDLIIADLNMPQMSGSELLSVVRRRFPQIATLAMSGGFPADKIPAGVIADGFFAKEESPRNLLAAIAGLVRKSRDLAAVHLKEGTPA